MLDLGAHIMLTNHYGVGGEVSLQPVLRNYGPLQFRQTFYDFNGIYAPVGTKRAVFDIHYAPNFGQQFQHDLVPEATVWVGYRLGGR